MGLWTKDRDGYTIEFIPSDYVFNDMDSEQAHRILCNLLDLLWEKGALSDQEVVEIIGYNELSTEPSK